MLDFGRTTYSPIGACIYCGARDDLRDEHVVPYGLGGTAILPKASCRPCAKITGGTEHRVLRGPMWPVRVLRNIRSRRPGDAPKKDWITIVRGGREERIDLPIDEYPVLLPFPLFPLPQALGGEAYRGQGIHPVGTDTIGFGPRPEDVAKKLGAQRILIDRTYQPAAFAAMIAKIGYSYAVAQLGRPPLLEPNVVASILRSEDRIGEWVGTLPEPPTNSHATLHYLGLRLQGSLLIADVRLFADSETPA